MKVLTFNRYRTINIILITAIFTVLEVMICIGARTWFPELGYTLSLCIIFASMEMMRWEFFGAIAAIASALTVCIASGADGSQFLIYGVGNLAMLLAVFFLKAVGAERVRKNILLTIVYVVIVFLLAQVGRWGVSTALGNDPALIVQFITTDALSGVFGIVVILILRKADGMFENQRSYLNRLEEERIRKEEKERNIYEAKLYMSASQNSVSEESEGAELQTEETPSEQNNQEVELEEPEDGGEWL